MKEIQIRGLLKIHEGQIEKFKEVATECIATVKGKDKGTLKYDWFFSPDMKECILLESYADSNALLEHMGNQGDQLGQLFALADMSAEIYGNPSEEIRQLIASLPMKVYSFYQGL